VNDLGALGSEQHRVLPTDAAAGSGHHGHQTVKTSHVTVSDRRTSRSPGSAVRTVLL
jgi:hypothetical protein